MFPGGIADKRGNRYEAKWLVRQFLDVVAAKADWLRFEGITPEFNGFEFVVSRSGVSEWHQTKVNSTGGNWTINALNREGVLSAFKQRLETDANAVCVFVSEDPAKDLKTLCGKVEIANSAGEFKGGLGGDHLDKFEQLAAHWKVDHNIAFEWLGRCGVRVLPEYEIAEILSSQAALLFEGDSTRAFAILREYLESRFNEIITTENARSDAGSALPLNLKDWMLDPTLRERIVSETESYLNSYSPFGAGGSTIPRKQTMEITEELLKDDGPVVVLVSGVAGCGKSGVVRGVINRIRENGVNCLAFRTDHHLDKTTTTSLGEALLGRLESPTTTLKGIEPDSLAVLFVDQIDAVSEVSGRNGAVKEAILRFVSEVRSYRTVRLVLVCRSFDLENDARLKALKKLSGVRRIDVPLLDWDDEIAPLFSEHCLDSSDLSASQRGLLCLPLNLSVYFELGNDGRGFQTRNDLFELLTKKKERAIRRDRNVPWAITAPLKELAKWMSDRQRLDAPLSVLDRFSGAGDLLASEGLIVRSRRQINFFHESYFDFIYARSFVGGDQSLLELLFSTEQHLFRRTQSRQILEALRQDDHERYYRDLRSVLTDSGVRYNVKSAISQWLGTLSDPTRAEAQIVFEAHDDEQKFHPLVRHAALSSPGWFDRLNLDNWIASVLNGKSDEKCESVLWWLSNISADRPEAVSDLLRGWWNGDPVRGDRLLGWFGFARLKSPTSALVSLCVDVLRSCPPGLFGRSNNHRREMLLATWAEEEADEGAEVLRAYFEAWFSAHPGQHFFEREELRDLDMHSMAELAKKSPRVFIEGTIDTVRKSIEVIAEKEKSGDYDYTFKNRIYSSDVFGADQFLSLFRSSIKKIAEEDSRTAKLYLRSLDPSAHVALLHIHLEAIVANGEALCDQLIPLLLCPELLNAGWSGAEWKSFADAAREALPYLGPQESFQVERLVLDIRTEIDFEIKIAHKIRDEGVDETWQNRREVMRGLNRSGFEQLCTLETIGKDRLSEKAAAKLDQLRRKFPEERVRVPRQMQFHKVGSPIKSSRAARMTDEQWLRAIGRYDKEDHRHRGHDFVTGGARELAHVLQTQAKENPERFASFLNKIPDDAHDTYIGRILAGLAESESCDHCILKRAIEIAHSRSTRPYGDEIARLFQKTPELAPEPAMFDILAWYIRNGDAINDEIKDAVKTEREIVSINDLMDRGGSLHLRGINGARGWAAEALGAVLWAVPEVIDRAWPLLDGRIENEELISVRCCLMQALVPLFNHDKERCAAAIEALANPSAASFITTEATSQDDFLSPLITRQGTRLLPYVLNWVPDVGRRLVSLLLGSGDETMRLIGAWHVLRQSFQSPEYIELADELIKQGTIHRRLAADVASYAIVHNDFGERAEALLLRFFYDEDKEVRSQAADVFRNIQGDEFGRYLQLSNQYLNSPAFNDGAWAFLRALEDATCSTIELVINASENLIADVEKNGTAGGRRAQDLHHLRDLIGREYAGSEHDPELRGRILDIIDLMMSRELYGIDRVLAAHDR